MAKKKKSSSKEKTDSSNFFRNLIFFAGILLIAYLYLRYKVSPTTSEEPITEQLILQRTWDNYYEDVDSIAKSFDLPTPYLMSLIVLECSGRKEFEPRFEEHIYKELKRARDTKDRFGSLDYTKFVDCNDGALKNLATSWGPFQLMGYQCIQMDVSIQDIRGLHAIYWGTYWIHKRYGKQLKKNELSHAFHIHNTGKPVPKDGKHTTYNPEYVPKGLAYYKYFKDKIKSEELKKQK